MAKTKDDKPKPKEPKRATERTATMAITNYPLADNSTDGQRLRGIISRLNLAWNELATERSVIIQKKDNAANGDAVFLKVGQDYFEGSDDAAKQANAADGFAEIDSAYGTGDAAIRQMVARLL